MLVEQTKDKLAAIPDCELLLHPVLLEPLNRDLRICNWVILDESSMPRLESSLRYCANGLSKVLSRGIGYQLHLLREYDTSCLGIKHADGLVFHKVSPIKGIV